MCFSIPCFPNDVEKLYSLIQEEINELDELNKKISLLKEPELKLPKFSITSNIKAKSSISLHNFIDMRDEVVDYHFHPTHLYFFVGCPKEIYIFNVPTSNNPTNLKFPQPELTLSKFIPTCNNDLITLFDNNSLKQYSREHNVWVDLLATSDPIISLHTSDNHLIIQFQNKATVFTLDRGQYKDFAFTPSPIIDVCVPNRACVSLFLTADSNILTYSLRSRELDSTINVNDCTHIVCNSQWTHYISYSNYSASVFLAKTGNKIYEVEEPIRSLSTDGNLFCILLDQDSEETIIVIYDVKRRCEISRLQYQHQNVQRIQMRKSSNHNYYILLYEGDNKFTLWLYVPPTCGSKAKLKPTGTSTSIIPNNNANANINMNINMSKNIELQNQQQMLQQQQQQQQALPQPFFQSFLMLPTFNPTPPPPPQQAQVVRTTKRFQSFPVRVQAQQMPSFTIMPAPLQQPQPYQLRPVQTRTVKSCVVKPVQKGQQVNNNPQSGNPQFYGYQQNM
ncbi:hypothetical protein GPJ56_009514 [Histomonas meleagridis]|uniref:uncharacterized protein n=1 Tax=Histomonas meleagridis TaxID=135588 RepID=UPI00355AA413|nr:hypothetical protein GPJ56_009514 [Histomonas meleagridis]KAH0802996.1 hypothetical protein GO595_004089 [Histomonas meleagridis]